MKTGGFRKPKEAAIGLIVAVCYLGLKQYQPKVISEGPAYFEKVIPEGWRPEDLWKKRLCGRETLGNAQESAENRGKSMKIPKNSMKILDFDPFFGPLRVEAPSGPREQREDGRGGDAGQPRVNSERQKAARRRHTAGLRARRHGQGLPQGPQRPGGHGPLLLGGALPLRAHQALQGAFSVYDHHIL